MKKNLKFYIKCSSIENFPLRIISIFRIKTKVAFFITCEALQTMPIATCQMNSGRGILHATQQSGLDRL